MFPLSALQVRLGMSQRNLKGSASPWEVEERELVCLDHTHKSLGACVYRKPEASEANEEVERVRD